MSDVACRKACLHTVSKASQLSISVKKNSCCPTVLWKKRKVWGVKWRWALEIAWTLVVAAALIFQYCRKLLRSLVRGWQLAGALKVPLVHSGEE